jgi:hypothetical protein
VLSVASSGTALDYRHTSNLQSAVRVMSTPRGQQEELFSLLPLVSKIDRVSFAPISFREVLFFS